MTEMALLSVKDLRVCYKEAGKENCVCRMSFEMEPGETVGIVGASGSGKSSGMQAILGLLPQTASVSAAWIRLEELDITPPQETKRAGKRVWNAYEKRMDGIRGARIAMVFQDPSAYLNPLVKVGRQITETIRCHKKCSGKEARCRAVELLDMAGIHNAKSRMDQYPFELSGGMRQRVVIAMALACEPDLIIADEPTTALDVTVQSQILDLLKKISKRTGTAILLVSHDMGVIASVCSRVLVMEKGEIVEEGSAEQIFYEPRHPYTRMLVEKAKTVMETAPKKKTGSMVLKAGNLSRAFGERCARGKGKAQEVLQDVSFEIKRGETFGLVGESGCGKTTLARILTGILEPTAGSVCRKGKVQMVFQDSYASFDPRFSVEQILKEPLSLSKEISREEYDARIDNMLELAGLDPGCRKKRAEEFSGGQRQRIAVARALMQEPDLLICDEPLSALDVPMQAQILKMLEQIQERTGMAYLFISHDLNVVKHISQRMAVMYLGHIVESGETECIYEDPWHPYTKQLLSAVLRPDPRKMRRRKKLLMWEEKKAEGIGEGCPFAAQCGYALERCKKEKPGNYTFGNRQVKCFLYSEEHTEKRRPGYPMISQI